MSSRNPFAYYMGDIPVQTCDADGRLSAIKDFSAAQLRAALKVPGLQKAVKRAIERRLDQVVDHHHNRKAKGKKS